MVMSSGPSADQLRQQAETSRMMSLYGGGSQRANKGRAPPRPAGPVQAERVPESKAPAQAQAIQGAGAIAGTALGLINPLLGMFLALGVSKIAQDVGERTMEGEQAHARQVARRNRRTAGQHALERQRYQQGMAAREERGAQAAPGQYLPPAPVDPATVTPGAIEQQQAILLR